MTNITRTEWLYLAPLLPLLASIDWLADSAVRVLCPMTFLCV